MNEITQLGDLVKLGAIGVFCVFAVQMVKLFLPYVKPAKNGHEAIVREFKPLHERQIQMLDKMCDKVMETNGKTISNHEALKVIGIEVHDINRSTDAILNNMPKRRGD